MKKFLVIIPLLLLVGCSNKVEEEKYAYLEYKDNLQKQEEFQADDELDFNTYFNIKRKNEEEVEYSITINNPKVDMNNIKALLIHDYKVDDVFPSVGIFDKLVSLLKDSEEEILLKGSIMTEKNIDDTKFKLYLEYTDDDGLENNIYYEVNRG